MPARRVGSASRSLGATLEKSLANRRDQVFADRASRRRRDKSGQAGARKALLSAQKNRDCESYLRGRAISSAVTKIGRISTGISFSLSRARWSEGGEMPSRSSK